MAQLNSLADAPGTLREYETIYILNPDTQNDQVGEVNERVRGIIEERGGKVIKLDNWGKRRLAYEIAKQRKGIYLYWQYLGNPDIVAEFERNMRMLDSVIRYMTIKVDADIDPNARPSELDDESYERAASTAADEEDLMLGAERADDGDEDYEGDEDEDESDADADSDDSGDSDDSDDDDGAASDDESGDSDEDDEEN